MYIHKVYSLVWGMKVHVNKADLALGRAKKWLGKCSFWETGALTSVPLVFFPLPSPHSFILSQSELAFENSVLAFGCSLSVQWNRDLCIRAGKTGWGQADVSLRTGHSARWHMP